MRKQGLACDWDDAGVEAGLVQPKSLNKMVVHMVGDSGYSSVL